MKLLKVRESRIDGGHRGDRDKQCAAGGAIGESMSFGVYMGFTTCKGVLQELVSRIEGYIWDQL